MKTLYTLALVLLCNMMMYAQADYWQGGLFFGISNYSGDINPTASPDFSDSGMSIGVVGQAYVSSKLGFRGSLIYANLSGNDQNYQERSERSFKFNTNLVELSAVAEWEPFGSNRYYSDAKGKVVMDKLVSPYIFGGLAVGLASLNTDFSNYNGGNETIMNGIRQDRDVGNSTAFFALPIGAGVKFDITERFTLALEVNGRIAFSDYIDGISAAGGAGDDIYFTSGFLMYYRFTQ